MLVNYIMESEKILIAPRTDAIIPAGVVDKPSVCGALYFTTMKHRLSKHPLFFKWKSMNQRCTDLNFKQFYDYGGAGIIVYKEWQNDFKTFYDWAITNGYSQGLILDRRDNRLGYSPENCRWVNSFVSSQNRRLLFKSNSSKYRGVDLRNGLWRARITYMNKKHHLGYFHTIEEAAMAYNKFVISHKTSHPLNILTL